GLSVKWVDGIRVYRGGYTGEVGGPAKAMTTPTSSPLPGFELVFAIAGLMLAFYALMRRAR
ncbi:MAG: hypothetical protein KAT65_29050, partial [Methanophagales archaeon]|nr:hypothetical protein [Methanophagales archaeon]